MFFAMKILYSFDCFDLLGELARKLRIFVVDGVDALAAEFEQVAGCDRVALFAEFA